MSETTYVYRAFDGADRLLYVGCSNDVAARMKSHASSSPWAVFMARHTIEAFPTREDAEAAESRAIVEEFPRWNVVGRSVDHPDGFATTAQQAEWLRPEREVAQHVKQLRSQVAKTRAKLRGLLFDLRLEESIVTAISNGTLAETFGDEDAALLLGDGA